MVDTRDLKSLAGFCVPVRVRSPAPNNRAALWGVAIFFVAVGRYMTPQESEACEARLVGGMYVASKASHRTGGSIREPPRSRAFGRWLIGSGELCVALARSCPVTPYSIVMRFGALRFFSCRSDENRRFDTRPQTGVSERNRA